MRRSEFARKQTTKHPFLAVSACYIHAYITVYMRLFVLFRGDALAEVRKQSAQYGVSRQAKKLKSYRKEVKKTEPYFHLTREERLACLQRLATELAGWADLRIFADVINKADFTAGKYDPYELAFEQIVTRYQTFLAKQGRHGIIVSDNNPTTAPRLTALSREFHKRGTLYARIPNVVETPLFVDSSLTAMIQMADLAAYSLRRFIDHSEELLWDLLKTRVHAVGSQAVGVRHYTGRRVCACTICVAHGRPAGSSENVSSGVSPGQGTLSLDAVDPRERTEGRLR